MLHHLSSFAFIISLFFLMTVFYNLTVFNFVSYQFMMFVVNNMELFFVSFTVMHHGLNIQSITPKWHMCASFLWLCMMLCCVGRFNGVVRLREKAPDAITSYMISAFAIDDLYGLGVTERPTKVRVQALLHCRQGKLPFSSDTLPLTVTNNHFFPSVYFFKSSFSLVLDNYFFSSISLLNPLLPFSLE